MPASSPMMRSGFSDLMYPGLNKAYMLAYNEYPVEYTQFLNVETSTQRQEEDAATAGFGLIPEKDEGDTPIFDVMEYIEKLEYLHKTYVMGYEVTEECMEDELYGIMKQGSRALAVAVKQTVDTLCIAPLDNAFTDTSAYQGVDGSPLCATDHSAQKTGTSVANRPATECDFSPTALKSALQTWEEWTNDNDLPLLIRPKFVVSGPGQRAIIGQTLGTEKEPFVADNEINAVREWELQRLILHYLSDSDAWFILSRPVDHFMKMFWRKRPAFRNYDDPNTGNARFLVRFRLSTGFTHWWGTYGSSGG